MNDIEIGIIGGTRGMGKWFADFLKGEGYTVHASGRTAGIGIAEMAQTCRVVVVSVPIGVTGDVIRRVGPLMNRNALLMDLTSVKREPVTLMMECSVSDVIGCHPLFGPQTESMNGNNVVLCPGRAGQWLPWLRGVLEKGGARVLETTPEQHDAMMAVVQGLNHLNTIVLGMALVKTGVHPSALEGFTTPLFETKLRIIDKIFQDNPRLYAEILTANPGVQEICRLYGESFAELADVLRQGDADGLTGMIERYAALLRPVVDR